MSEEKKTLFRKKSVDYIDSPEKLDNYLHVTNPGVWVLLLAVLVLLVGFVVWGVMGKLETKETVAVVSVNGKCEAYVPQDVFDAGIEMQTINIDDQEYALDIDASELIDITDDTDVYIRMAGKLNVGDIVYGIPLDGSVDDGVYSGTIVTESISPWTLLLN